MKSKDKIMGNVCVGRCPSVCLLCQKHPKADCHWCMNAAPMTGAPEHHQLSSLRWLDQLLVEVLLQSDNGCFSFALRERSLAQEWEKRLSRCPATELRAVEKTLLTALTIPGKKGRQLQLAFTPFLSKSTKSGPLGEHCERTSSAKVNPLYQKLQKSRSTETRCSAIVNVLCLILSQNSPSWWCAAALA